MIPVLVFLLISGLVGGGASVAAESSLPGDLLYAIKIGVNERVEGAFTTSAEAKADFDTKMALRRITEAESLSIRGNVSSDIAAQLEANFKAHADRVAERVAEFEADGKLDTALEANSDFQSSLNAHQAILVRLANEDEDESDKRGLLGLSVRIGNAISARDAFGSRVELKLRASADFQAAAEGKSGAAQNKVDEVRKFLDANETSVSADVKAKAEARLTEANSAIAQGKIKIEAKAYGEAFVLFQRAMRLAQEAKMTINGNVDIKIKLLERMEVDRDNDEEDENDNQESSRKSSGNVDAKGNASARSGNSGTNANGEVKVKIGL